MASLRDRIVAEIDRREQTARKATSGQWCSDIVGDIYALRKPPVAAHVGEIDRAADAEHIALHDPADALRRYTADRERLEEHHPCNDDDTDDPCGAHSSRSAAALRMVGNGVVPQQGAAAYASLLSSMREAVTS